MYNEDQSEYDFVNEYYHKLNLLIYPTMPKKPLERNYSKHSDYGIAMDKYDKDMAIFRNELREYRQKEEGYVDEFKKSLLEYFDITNHPKATKLYSMTWEDGHSNGLNEVAMKAEDLAELLT